MAQVSGISASLDGRIKRTVRAHGIEINDLVGRTLVEGILRHWHHGMGQSPIELKGVLLFDQHVRPTSDADITSCRGYLPHEVWGGMRIIRHLLEAEGMGIDDMSQTAQRIDVGHGDPVERWTIRGSVGGVRALTRLNIAIGRGPDAFSSSIEMMEIPSLVTKLPALTIACQPQTDMRVKHLADDVRQNVQAAMSMRAPTFATVRRFGGVR